MLPRPRDAEHLLTKKTLQEQDDLNVLGPVAALPALGAQRGEELGELALPIAQRVDLDAGHLARGADADRLLSFRREFVSVRHGEWSAFRGGRSAGIFIGCEGPLAQGKVSCQWR